MGLKNVPSYSISSANLMEECPRRYWYAKYGSWGGWEKRATDHQRAVYLAKNTTGLFMYAGTIVHGIAERICRRALGGALQDIRANRERFLRHAESVVDQQIGKAVSESLSGEWEQKPKDNVHFQEHMFGEELDTKFMRERCMTSVNALLGKDDDWPEGRNYFFDVVGSRQIQETEKLVHTDNLPLRVYSATDLTTYDPQNKVTWVWDWKTGKPNEKHETQAMLYTTVEHLRGAQKPASRIVYLTKKISIDTRIPDVQKDLQTVRDMVSAFATNLAGRLVEGDLKQNKAIEEAFPATTDTSVCDGCEFRLICDKDGTRPKAAVVES